MTFSNQLTCPEESGGANLSSSNRAFKAGKIGPPIRGANVVLATLCFNNRASCGKQRLKAKALTAAILCFNRPDYGSNDSPDFPRAAFTASGCVPSAMVLL